MSKPNRKRTILRHLLLLSAVRAMGGQAVLNGVMMRGEKYYAVACRRMDGSIDVQRFDVPSFAQRFVKIPLLRGVMGLGEAMALGYRSLMHSADLMIEDEEEKERLESAQKTDTKVKEKSVATKEKAGLGKFSVGLSVAFSITFFVALFIVTPLLASRGIENAFSLSHWQGFVLESVFRLTIFMGYLFFVSFIPDIKRVFQYHGAEHKAIAAYENGVVLEPRSAQQFSTAHVRCGTNFLLIVMVMSIVFYAAIAAFFPDLDFWALILSRIIVIPLIAAISYEIIRGAAPRMGSHLVRFLIRPGLALQKLTTRKPADDQCEVAIRSLKEVFNDNQIQDVESRTQIQAPRSWQTIEEVRIKL